jgi:hypothetical protein
MVKLHLGDLAITSPSFEPGGPIPADHTGDGADVSPELAWHAAPSGTRQFALVCHDPDAPLTYGFTHWVVYGMPADVTGIPQGGGSAFTEGQNDFGERGYLGPAPPPGHGRHHYFFHLYALDNALDAAAGLTRSELLQRIDDHIIVQARLVGTYQH